jgi:hypothetical protein
VSPFQLGAALAVLAGAVLAVSARDIRWILGGLVVAIGLAAILADPLPSPLAVAIRVLAAVLGAELILIAVRGSAPGAASLQGSPVGPIAPALAAAAAFAIGYASSGVGSPADGPAVATATGLGVAAIAAGPLVLGRDLPRIGSGLVLLATAAELVRAGLAGTPGPFEQAVIGGLTVAVLGVLAGLIAVALRSGHDLSVAGALVRETRFEAHPLAAATRGSAAGTEARRPVRGRSPAAGPRRDAAAHQLTLEERLRFMTPAADADGEPAPATAVTPGSPRPATDAEDEHRE